MVWAHVQAPPTEPVPSCPLEGLGCRRRDHRPGGSTAWHEAAVRGLSTELHAFLKPDRSNRDALPLVDLTSGPVGRRLMVDQRIAEVLGRYPSTHPAHRSMTAAAPEMTAAVARAAARLGLPAGGVHDADPHSTTGPGLDVN